MKYKIRKAKLDDAKGIARVHIQSWRETYRGIVDDEYLKSLELKPRTLKWEESLGESKKDSWFFVAEDDNSNIVGFISGGIAREPIEQFKGELYAIYILKKHQKNKLGFRLTKKLCAMLSKQGVNTMFVCVLRDNISKAFYTKYGATLFKTKKIKIGKQLLIEEYYGWKNLDNFIASI